MRINPFLYGVLVLGVFLGVIYGFRWAGVWSISGKVDAQGERMAPAADNVETIKGWMTIGEIAAVYNVPLPEMLAQFQLPGDTPAETAVKDLESETFSVSGLRDWLQTRLDSGAAPQPEASTPPAPPEMVVPTPTPEATQAGPTDAQPTGPQGSGSGVPDADHSPTERRVNARTTFQELLDWGVPVEAIQAIIGSDLPNPGTVVKDFVTAQGQEFSSAKNALQVEVDKLSP